MGEEDLKKDLQKFIEERMAPIRDKNLIEQRSRYKEEREKLDRNFETIWERDYQFINYLISLEVTIFAALVAFKGGTINTLLFWALFFLLISIIFGVLSQFIRIQVAYWSHEDSAISSIENDWWIRALWKDPILEDEKKILSPGLETQKKDLQKKQKGGLLKLLNLNADRIEFLFKVSFIIALILFWLSVRN